MMHAVTSVPGRPGWYVQRVAYGVNPDTLQHETTITYARSVHRFEGDAGQYDTFTWRADGHLVDRALDDEVLVAIDAAS